MRFYFFFILFTCLLPFGLGAQPKKKSKGPSASKRFYHNVTGRYNAYYNAEMRLSKSFETLEQQYLDNFNRLVPLYAFSAVDNAQSVQGPLDEAIKKSAINIELHRMSHWVDDSYFLIGQAEFLKKDYEKAAETFLYIVDRYNPDKAKSAMNREELSDYQANRNKEIRKKKREQEKAKEERNKEIRKKKRKQQKKKKKKKKSSKKKKKKKKEPNKKAAPIEGTLRLDTGPKKPKKPQVEVEPTEEELKNGKPKSYFLKHRPIRYDAMVWLARTYIELKRYDDAGLYLRLLDEDGRTPYKLRPYVQALMAHALIKQKNEAAAIEPLAKAVEQERKRKVRNRYAFALAQLYSQNGQYDEAMAEFERVIKGRPNYEMEFNARLNLARNAGLSNSDELDADWALRKLLRDPKNEEYRSQIHFVIAELALRNGQRERGFEALKQAMALGASPFQQTEAALLLAQLYDERKDFAPAYAYYDTCLSSMSKEDERRKATETRKNELQPLAKALITIAAKDTALAIAALSPEKQKEIAARLRSEEKAKAAAAKAAPSKRDQVANATTVSAVAANRAEFPLYSEALRRKGQKDFVKRWGNRGYADNWRRNSSQEMANNQNQNSRESKNAPITKQEVESYLQKLGVPQNEQEVINTKKVLASALFEAGSIYRSDLQMIPEAQACFLRIIDELSAHSSRELETLYFLMLMAQEQKLDAKATFYRQLILSKYANSDIAKSITDPNFMGAKESENLKLNQQYDALEKLVKDRQYENALSQIKTLKASLDKHPLKPRFALLEAICIGGSQGEAAYIDALKSVKVAFGDTPEAKQAEQMLRYLESSGKAQTASNTPSNTNNNKQDAEALKLFEDNMNTGHYVLIAFKDKKTPTNQYRDRITDYNKAEFDLLRLNVSALLLDGDTPTLIIRKFKDGAEAMNYYRAAKDNSKFLGANAPEHDFVVIGQNNYRTVLQKMNFNNYLAFFEQTYLK